jgi:hypothetical protein
MEFDGVNDVVFRCVLLMKRKMNLVVSSVIHLVHTCVAGMAHGLIA